MSLSDQLRNVVLPAGRGNGRLGGEDEREPIISARGVAQRSTGQGIASPLTEQQGFREYHPERSLTDSSGLFVVVVSSVQSALFVDANGADVEIHYIDSE